MKKIYITPNTKVIKVKLATMIALSDPKAGLNPKSSVDADDIDSRSNDYWDDEY
jgi:hypothetical protein